MAVRQIFCALEQTETPHQLSVDPINGEILATCECGRFLKFPPSQTPESFTQLLTAHKEANAGQVSLEATEKLLESLGDPVQPTENPAG